MLLTHWSQQVIDSAFAVLTDEQQKVLRYHLDYSIKHPGVTPTAQVWRKMFKFASLEEYQAVVDTGLQAIRDHFAKLNIRSTADLAFDEPSTSHEGAFLRKPRKKTAL